jgi:two-component system cell cycle sensor histidine kinase/response regulator CckA
VDLQALLDASSELLCATDAQWVVAHANRRWEAVLGYAPDTLRGGSLRTLLHPDDRSALAAALAGTPGVGALPPFVARLLAADGSYQALDWRVTRQPDGTLLTALRLCWEIAAVEEDVRESYHRLRSLVERSLDAFFVKDLDGRYQFINPSGAAYLDRTVEEVLGRTDEDVFGPETAADIVRIDRAVLEGGEPFTYQTTRDDFGESRAFLSTKYPFHDRFGKLAGLMGVSHDVSAWLQAQELARRSDASFRRLVEASPDLVVVHEGGSVVYANPSALLALGCSSMDELEGTHLLDLVRPTDREMVRMEETGEFSPATLASRVQEVGLTRADGAVIQAEIVELEVHWEGSTAQALLARDITERRQLEAQLAQADRLASVGTLAAGVAHEINNPLTYVLHNLEEIERRLEPRDRELSRLAGEAGAGAQRIRTIVKDLMLFARHEQGGSRSALDIHELLEKAIQLGFSQIRHRARLVRDFGDVALVAGDPGRLSQIFLNLLVNAAQAIGVGDAENNEIRVSTHSAGGEVHVRVQDTGSGIPDAVLDRIFEPFITTKSVGEGTGLGLWICHSLVTAAKGRIECETELGVGTTFTVSLPLALEELASPRAPAGPLPARLRPGLRVLVVDDEVLIGRLIQAGLADEAEVVAVTSGREALELLQVDEAFDVILSDLMMPDVTGMELHACLEANAPHLAERMVFMTGGAFNPEDRRFLDGVEGRRVAKPFSMADIRRAIEARADGGS